MTKRTAEEVPPSHLSSEERQPAPSEAQPKPSEARQSESARLQQEQDQSRTNASNATEEAQQRELRQKQANQPAYNPDEQGSVPGYMRSASKPWAEDDKDKELEKDPAQVKKEEEEQAVLEEQEKVKEELEEVAVKEGQAKIHTARPEEEEHKVLKRSQPALDEVSIPKKRETKDTSGGTAGVGGPTLEVFDKEWEAEQQRIAEAQRDTHDARQKAEGVDHKEKIRQEGIKMQKLREQVKEEAKKSDDENPLS